MTVIVMASRIQCGLVDWRRGNAGNLSGFSLSHGGFYEAETGLTAPLVELAERDRCAWNIGVMHIERFHINAGVQHIFSSGQTVAIAENADVRSFSRRHRRQRLDDDFRADSCGVTHGYADGCAHAIVSQLVCVVDVTAWQAT